MKNRTVKVGDKFTLCGYTWEVTGAECSFFSAKSDINQASFSLEDYADKLSWLEPEVKKLTKEQAEMIKEKFSEIYGDLGAWNGDKKAYKAWLDSITEKT